MYPLDFEEFALFLSEELLLEYICKCYQNREPLEKSMHNKAMRLFKEYILVGGMPQAVLAYKNGGRDYAAADTEKSVGSREKIVLSSIDTNPTFDSPFSGLMIPCFAIFATNAMTQMSDLR